MSGAATTVLVIDDEELIVTLLREILKRDGYEVLSAGNGRDGIELFKERRDDVSCVILDLTMPGLSGREVYKSIRQLECSVPVIFSSGYGIVDDLLEVVREDQLKFLPKPFSPSEVTQFIREALVESR